MVEKIKELLRIKQSEEKKSDNILNVFKLRQKINYLENENEVLKEQIKSRLYEVFLDKIGEPDTIARLKKENYRLRKHNRELKEKLKNSSV